MAKQPCGHHITILQRAAQALIRDDAAVGFRDGFRMSLREIPASFDEHIAITHSPMEEQKGAEP